MFLWFPFNSTKKGYYQTRQTPTEQRKGHTIGGATHVNFSPGLPGGHLQAEMPQGAWPKGKRRDISTFLWKNVRFGHGFELRNRLVAQHESNTSLANQFPPNKEFALLHSYKYVFGQPPFPHVFREALYTWAVSTCQMPSALSGRVRGVAPKSALCLWGGSKWFPDFSFGRIVPLQHLRNQSCEQPKCLCDSISLAGPHLAEPTRGQVLFGGLGLTSRRAQTAPEKFQSLPESTFHGWQMFFLFL